MQGHPDFCQADLPVFLLTVDGVYCRIEEPQHPTKSKGLSYSHTNSKPRVMITNLVYQFLTISLYG